jgi:hypothetical protein
MASPSSSSSASSGIDAPGGTVSHSPSVIIAAIIAIVALIWLAKRRKK